MEKVNQFYSTYVLEDSKHEFDIKELKEETFRGIGVAISFGNGKRYGGEIMNSKTTPKDYDDVFIKKLFEIEPAYRIEDFLNYHFQHYENENGSKELFIKQIEYVILPRIENFQRTGYIKIVKDWIINKQKMLLQKQLQEKNEFLRKAYELACQEYPESPLSVDINPIEFGKSIGFNETTTRRIMNELVADGFVNSGLGMLMLMVTQKGLNHLRKLEIEENETPLINFNVGNNSNVQFQQGTINSNQNISITSNDIEQLEKLISEIKQNANELKNYLTTEKHEELFIETVYLEKSLKKGNPDGSKVKLIVKEIYTILKAVPDRKSTRLNSS